MNKATTKILKELSLSADFKTFYKENNTYMINNSLSELLSVYLKEKGLKKSDVIKDSELTEVYAYQIFSGLRIPERKKLLALALAMKLNLDEVQRLLKSAGYSQLYVKLPFDSIIIYGFCKKLSVVEVNEILYSYNLDTLG